MLDDPSFQQYLKEKWENGDKLVPHPHGGGKLIKMLSAYTGYPEYRNFISGEYQKWLNSQQINEFRDAKRNIDFDHVAEVATNIIYKDKDISAVDLYNSLMNSDELSFTDKLALCLLDEQIKEQITPEKHSKISGLTYTRLFNFNHSIWEDIGDMYYGDILEKLFSSWPEQINTLNQNGPSYIKAFKGIASFFTKRPFSGSYDIDPKDIIKELDGYKVSSEFLKDIDVDQSISNLEFILKQNLNESTYKSLANMYNILKGSNPEYPLKSDPIWGLSRVSYFYGSDHMKRILAFIQNPVYLNKEDENMLLDQLNLVDENEEPHTAKLLKDLYASFKTTDFSNFYNLEKKAVVDDFSRFDEDKKIQINIQDIVFPEVGALFGIASQGDIKLTEVTLPKGGGLSITAGSFNSKGNAILDNCNGEDLRNIEVTSILNSELSFKNLGEISSANAKNCKLICNGSMHLDIGHILNSVIIGNNNRCDITFSYLEGNKISNALINLLSEQSAAHTSKNNLFSNCDINLQVYNYGSSKIKPDYPNIFDSCRIKSDGTYDMNLQGSFTNCDISQKQSDKDLNLLGNFKDCLIETHGEFYHKPQFKFREFGGHFDNVVLSNISLVLPDNLADCDNYSATSLLLHNCTWHGRAVWSKDQEEIYKKLKSKLNFQEYNEDPLADVSKGAMTTKELMGMSDNLEDEISIESDDFIDDLKELEKQKDMLAKNYKRYVQKNDPQYKDRIESIKKEITEINDKIESTKHSANTTYQVRSYLEDMPDQLYKAYFNSLDNETLKKKLSQYISNNQVEVGKNYKSKLNEIRSAYTDYTNQQKDLEQRNKSQTPTLF